MDYICSCGHKLDEHGRNPFSEPCEIKGCMCVDYSGEHPEPSDAELTRDSRPVDSFEGIGDFNSDDAWQRYAAHQAAKGNY